MVIEVACDPPQSGEIETAPPPRSGTPHRRSQTLLERARSASAEDVGFIPKGDQIVGQIDRDALLSSHVE